MSRIFLNLTLLLILLIFRILIEMVNTDSLLFMSLLTYFAFLISIFFIIDKSILMMNEEQKKKSRNGVKQNIHINNFKKAAYICLTIILIVGVIYIVIQPSSLFNDLITIATLLFAVQDSEFAKTLKKLFYRYQ